jgi:Rrf2 family protein
MARPTNTQFALAVHVLTLLGSDLDERHSSEFLADSAGSSAVHVRRVLGGLRRAGLVRSRPGPNGGWQLVAPLRGTTLADVWRAVNGNDPLLGLHSANPACTVGRRIHTALVDVDRRAAAALVAELDHTTLADLVEETAALQPVPQ